MARFQLSALGIGVYQDSNGRAQVDRPFTLTGGPLYAAESGSGTQASLLTTTGGHAPGWLDPVTDPGTYTIAFDGNASQTFAVGDARIGTSAANTLRGTGSPEGTQTASVGQLYQQSDAATGKSLWVKNTGTGNTGWRLKRTAISHDIMLYGPEPRTAAALTAAVGATYGFQGDALSASTAFLLGGVSGIVLGCFWQVVWTPNDAACGIRLISADAGPTNITQLAELTGNASATPVNDGAFIAAATIQALYDFTAAQSIGGTSKTLGYQTKGSGAVAPVLYMSRLQVILEV